jgi:hypothetical protein
MCRFRHQNSAPVDETLDNRHLSLLELLLGVTTSSVGQVDGMSDLDVIGEGDILHLNTAAAIMVNIPLSGAAQILPHSWVSHFPKSFTSEPSLEISLGRVVAIF